MTLPEVKSEKQLANEKSERILEGFAVWTSFYRANPHRFAKDYLNINLKKFQAIILYEMNRENYSMYVASRGWPQRICGIITRRSLFLRRTI